MPRKWGLTLEPLTRTERKLVLDYLNGKITPEGLLDRVRRQMAGKGRPRVPLETNLPGFAKNADKLRGTWKQLIRGAGMLPASYDAGSNYWKLWVSFRPFRIAAPRPDDYLAFLLTRAVATGQIKRFICCQGEVLRSNRWERCRKFVYMKRARSDMRFCSNECRNAAWTLARK